MNNNRHVILACIIVAALMAVIIFLTTRGKAQVECFPSQTDITNTIRNIEVIRVEAVRQTELLKELRAASGIKAKKP